MNLQEYCTHIQFSRCGAAHLGALQYYRPLPPRTRTGYPVGDIQSRIAQMIIEHETRTMRKPSRVILPQREYGELLAAMRMSAMQRIVVRSDGPLRDSEHLIFHTVPIYPGPVYAPEIYA